MEKFICSGCGACCRTFSLASDFQGEIPGFFDGPVIYWHTPSLKIYDFETDAFDAERIAMGSVVFDLKSGRTIVLDYTLKEASCPNLDGKNRCRVYGKRPLVCRQFPSPYVMISQLSPNGRFRAFLGRCGSDLPPEGLKRYLGFPPHADMAGVNPLPLLKRLYARYGDAALAGVAGTLVYKSYLEVLSRLEQKGEIKMAKKGYDMKALVKRIENSERVTVSAFFEEKGERPPRDLLTPQFYENLRRMLA